VPYLPSGSSKVFDVLTFILKDEHVNIYLGAGNENPGEEVNKGQAHQTHSPTKHHRISSRSKNENEPEKRNLASIRNFKRVLYI
jgi:hypothetical protein